MRFGLTVSPYGRRAQTDRKHFPVFYAQVSDSALRGEIRSAFVPSHRATTLPHPRAPRAGRSPARRSALPITSRSCSTSSSVLPRSRRRCRRRDESAVCRAGAVRWSARRARTTRRTDRCRSGSRGGCAAPRRPIMSAPTRCSVRYSNPTSIRKLQAIANLLQQFAGDLLFALFEFAVPPKNAETHSSSGVSHTSTIVRPLSPFAPPRRPPARAAAVRHATGHARDVGDDVAQLVSKRPTSCASRDPWSGKKPRHWNRTPANAPLASIQSATAAASRRLCPEHQRPLLRRRDHSFNGVLGSTFQVFAQRRRAVLPKGERCAGIDALPAGDRPVEQRPTRLV